MTNSKTLSPDFDPHNPLCPGCGASLEEWEVVERKPYTEPAGELVMYDCALCGAFVGVFVPETINPDDPYVIEEVS